MGCATWPYFIIVTGILSVYSSFRGPIMQSSTILLRKRLNVITQRNVKLADKAEAYAFN